MTKTILITGSSSGIGKATAKYFQEKGWNVVATMRKPEDEQELTTLERVHVVKLDVQDKESIQSAVQAGIKRFGKIDVLLNNAGYGAYGLLEATSREKIQRQFDVNVFGLMAVTQALLPHFRTNKDGMVINISSIGGKVTFPLGTLYHATKHAVEGLSKAMSYELEHIGCQMKIVQPGMIKTDFGGRSFDFTNDTSLIEYQDLVQKLLVGFGATGQNASEPKVVAEVIYEAATDGKSQLSYPAGEDAKAILANPKGIDDAAWMTGVKAQFGLEEIPKNDAEMTKAELITTQRQREGGLLSQNSAADEAPKEKQEVAVNP